jgi:hypothetical protein
VSGEVLVAQQEFWAEVASDWSEGFNGLVRSRYTTREIMNGALLNPFGESGSRAQIRTEPRLERTPASGQAISASELFDLTRSVRED